MKNEFTTSVVKRAVSEKTEDRQGGRQKSCAKWSGDAFAHVVRATNCVCSRVEHICGIIELISTYLTHS